VSKALVCSCEDVTVADVKASIAKGYRDIESVKRYTGFGTGICQGKSCLASVARIIAETGKVRHPGILPFTPRPPYYATELSVLATTPVDAEHPPAAGTSPSPSLDGWALRPEGPVSERAEVVIVGGGIMGLALAHNLALRGQTDVVVVEESYLCAGASGRNGGGVRMQWGTETNIELAKRSIDLMKTFAREVGINIWLRQGGYLLLAKSSQIARQLERATELHNKMGVPTQILTPGASREIVPQLTLKDVQLCAYNKEDGVIFPWPFLWGYAQSCQRRGVKVETFTQVTGFEISQGLIRKVRTDRGDIACNTVVLATGAWSPNVARLAGVALPNEPYRHEILSTEPLKPFLGPLVSLLDNGLYFSQSMRGEIVGGMGDPRELPGLEMGSTLRFLARFSQALLEQLPIAGRTKVVRQWAGCYDVTPDNNPILGRTPGLENLLQMSGFVGHGFMMAPAVAERMAEWMIRGIRDDLFTRFNLSRFSQAPLAREEMIIG
jgi:sarcosine oxidase subunit beta